MEKMHLMTLSERFKVWHNKNPIVFQLFEKFTLQAIGYGKTKSSAWLIVNRIRWETSIVTRGDDFKISNDFIAMYSRMFMEKHPEHAGFFTTKKMSRTE